MNTQEKILTIYQTVLARPTGHTLERSLGTGDNAQTPHARGAEEASDEADVFADKPRILLVDDEEGVRCLSKTILGRKGFAVVCCEEGAEAIAKLQEDPEGYDLIILDMVMPKMGGHEAFHEIQKINPRIPVILASGYSIEGKVQNCLDHGAVAFLPKPFSVSELLRHVAEALESSLR